MIFKTKPFAHQRKELEINGQDVYRAIFWEQGTGKSKLVIDEAADLYRAGLIRSVLVIAPSGVARNWVTDELPTHLPDDVAARSRMFEYQSAKASTKYHQQAADELLTHEGLAWLVVTYDSAVTEKGKRFLNRFLGLRRPVLYVLDESQAIKSPQAKRTKAIVRSGRFGDFRRVLTGTPIAQGPFDLYKQIEFLDRGFWEERGFSTYTEFKHYFGRWRKAWNPTAIDPITKKTGREYEVLEEYVHLDELYEMIQPISSRVTKDEVLDLPPKLYQKVYFDMSPEQARLYRELKEECVAWIRDQSIVEALKGCPMCNGTKEIVVEGMIYPCDHCAVDPHVGETPVFATLAMVRLLRLQQIACGFLPTGVDEPVHVIPGADRRVSIVADACEASAHKVIVWSRFRMGVTMILEELQRRGISTVRYDGEVDEEGRAEAKARFNGFRATLDSHGQVIGRQDIPEKDQAKVFVGNPATGATGLTLIVAKTVIYHSNSFKLIDRLQSEDRCHRIGQTDSVLYIDVQGCDVDEKIVENLREKRGVSYTLLGDLAKEWI
jgi:SNF2 family DNA or RNA helicase